MNKAVLPYHRKASTNPYGIRRLATFGLLLALWGPPAFRGDDFFSSSALILGGLDTAATFQVAVAGIMLMIALFLFGNSLMANRSPLARIVRGSSTSFYLLYGALLLVSTLYSDYPAYTFYKAIQWWSVVVLVGILLSQRNVSWFHGLRVLVLFYSVIVVQNLFLYVLRPEMVMEGVRLYGGGFFARDFGFAGYILFLFGLARFAVVRRFRTSVIAVILIMLGLGVAILSLTRGVMITIVAQAFILPVLVSILGESKRVFLVLFVLVMVSILIFGSLSQAGDFILRGGYGLDTLSGRVEIWRIYELYWRESPLVGHGYAAASRFLAFAQNTMTGAHSDFWQLLVGLGVIGLGLMTGTLLLGGISLLRVFRIYGSINSPEERMYFLFLVGMFLGLIASGFVSQVFSNDFPSTIAVTAIVLMSAQRLINELYRKAAREFRARAHHRPLQQEARNRVR